MRRNGFLLPISSLPSKYGIGSFSKEAYEFVDILEKANQKIWQILPLGPTGYGDSPYQSFSTFAGNPYFIDLDKLIEEKLLTQEECDSYDWGKNDEYIDYEKIYLSRFKILKKAYKRSKIEHNKKFQAYCKYNKWWLDDYALYMAIKDSLGGISWLEWDDKLKLRDKKTVLKYSKKLEEEITFYKYIQYLFSDQWHKLKEYANKKGISIVGDIPIYVALDSADTWANPELFQFDKNLNPIAVAGCPPDSFSEDGQLWGNPLYDWEYHKYTHYKWWIKRIKYCYNLYDIVRIDHFRGFDTYWKIPVSCPTAEIGEWVEAPGYELFDMINKKIPDIHIVAEDLGDLREEVFELRDHYGLSGMKIVQFELDPYESNNDFKETQNTIVYTGTHDNQTLVGWYKNLSSYQKRKISQKFKKYKERKCTDRIIHAVFNSVADLVIFPVQDLLALDDAARINTPGTVGSPNWEWRLTSFDELKTVLPVYKKLIQKSKRKGNNLSIPN